MLLSALLLTAAIQVATPPPPTVIIDPLGRSAEIKRTYPSQRDVLNAVTRQKNAIARREAWNARARLEACRGLGLQWADQSALAPPWELKRLGDLPPANHTLTVLRSVDGCPVSSTIRFNVDLPAGR